MKTKKPSAIVYGWRELGTFTLTTDVYFEENLEDEVILLGKTDKQEITPEEIAQKISTNNYEVTSKISAILPRMIFKKE